MILKVGFDIDGTITEDAGFFAQFSRIVKANGGKVFIVSSRTDNEFVLRETKKELKQIGIHFDEIYLLPDFECAKANCIHLELDWYQKYIFQKINFCKEKNIQIFFDDEGKVIDLFRRYAPEIIVIKIGGKVATKAGLT